MTAVPWILPLLAVASLIVYVASGLEQASRDKPAPATPPAAPRPAPVVIGRPAQARHRRPVTPVMGQPAYTLRSAAWTR
jgi:hypothetical protein